ncbi:MAG TPA: FadR/GntR family transcriptional regulator [Azospirillum sp.]|nr:FadR/GntR family transcriptional regulator [Azospirillum sp.]
MELPTVKVERLYRQISNVLIQFIRDGHFAPGQLLPGERDLAKQLGVSRSSVREALIALEINGWVEIRTGHGVFVSQRLPNAVEVAPDDGVGVEYLMEAREVVEGEIAALAARNATDAQLADITRLVEEMEGQVGDMAAFHDHDRRFHELIGAMTGNPVFVEITDLLWRKRQSPHYVKFEEQYSEGAIAHSMCADHRGILQALQSRNAKAARTAMQKHIRNAQSRLFASQASRGAPSAQPGSSPAPVAERPGGRR